MAGGLTVADMLNEADFPPPERWDEAVGFGLGALKLLPRAKISIAADAVAITAIAGSEDEKRRFETELARARPQGLAVTMDISAPRTVLTPFTLRFVKDGAGARFDACSADTERARETILAAAVASGVEGKIDCTIGLGVPTPRWAEAVAAGLAAVSDLGAGAITFSDADVTLLAGAEVPQALFDRVVGDLDAALPDVFSLDAKLPPKPDTSVPEGPPELTATLSADGRLQVRGRLTDAAQRDAVTSFARARFGADAVNMATRLDSDLPDGWPIRVLAGLQALSELHQGTLLVQAGKVDVAGVAGATQAQARITQTLSGQLGQGQAFSVSVRYDERLDPLAALPTPQECVADLNRVLTQTKVAFAPGSAEIETEGGRTLDKLAEILKRCVDVPMQIAGHTDSQGSESGNLALSQARAEAVLVGLQGRRVPVGALTAVGYGESVPLEDNRTEAGREANRRIEFSLINPPDAPYAAEPEFDTAASDVAAPGAATPDAEGAIVVPVNADPDAPGASPPERRPDPAPAETEARPAPEALPADEDTAIAASSPAPAQDGDAAGSEAEPALPRAAVIALPAPRFDTASLAPIIPADAPLPAAASGQTTTADPASPEEPFVSVAPTDPTIRPRSRPVSP
jgi:OmpA-OmpF porin, OOP family